MVTETGDCEATSTDRRTMPLGPAYGRRWDDDPYQAEMFQWAQQDLGKRLYGLREDLGWSLERVATAIKMKAETIADAENSRGDPKLSTISRLLAFYGYYTRVLPERAANVAPRCRGANHARSAQL